MTNTHTNSALLAPDTWSGRVFTGTWVAPRGGTTTDVEPATGKALAEIGMANPEDIAASSLHAAEQQRAWAERTHVERAGILLDAAELIGRHWTELREWIMRETGGVAAKADLELHDAQQRLRQAAAMVYQPSGGILPTEQSERLSYAQRLPVGVVGVISPFNFPLVLSMRSVAPALAVGNSVVLKPDIRTPVSGGILIARVLEEAGLPAGVLHVVPGKGSEAGAALVDDDHVGVVSFTGSTAVGRKIGEATGAKLKRALLELGGKNPLVVLDDADVEAAASAGAWGNFFHQGQICMATGRHLVHESIADDYIDALTSKANQMRVGDPFQDDTVEVGPIIDAKQRDNVDSIVQDTIRAGARATTGTRYDDLFYQPTVLADVDPGMAAYEEEIFGPVAAVTTFANDEEAIQLANDTPYGLKAAVHGGSLAHGIAVGDRLHAGGVHVNEPTVGDEATVPFAAAKASGHGAIGGPANVEEFTRWQWITQRRTPTGSQVGGG